VGASKEAREEIMTPDKIRAVEKFLLVVLGKSSLSGCQCSRCGEYRDGVALIRELLAEQAAKPEYAKREADAYLVDITGPGSYNSKSIHRDEASATTLAAFYNGVPDYRWSARVHPLTHLLPAGDVPFGRK
jgi:hypothetical protein